MGNPIPTLKVILILIIAVNAIWFTDRLVSLIGLDILTYLPTAVWQLLSAFSTGLLIIFNVLLLGLLSRLQLKDE